MGSISVFFLNTLYNDKHNEANLEDSRDGANDNHSWNCGVDTALPLSQSFCELESAVLVESSNYLVSARSCVVLTVKSL